VRLPGMLLVLIMLIRDSANFKIRTHAAAAIMMLQSRDLYADSYPDAVQVPTPAHPCTVRRGHRISRSDRRFEITHSGALQVIVTVLSDLSGSSAFTARPHPSSTMYSPLLSYRHTRARRSATAPPIECLVGCLQTCLLC
jgi:hypothetical protein